MEQVISPYAIVSVVVNSQSANIQVKVPLTDRQEFTLDVKDASGNAIPLLLGSTVEVANFKLLEYTAPVKVGSGDYRIALQYPDKDKVLQTVERVFTRTMSGSWQKLAHAPISSGDFTGAALAGNLSKQMVVCRYKGPETWDILQYTGANWKSTQGTKPIPRHNALAFVLSDQVQKETIFLGFGYQVNEKLPGKKAYLSDFSWAYSFYYLGQYDSLVIPLLERSEGDSKYFQTTDNAYILRENSTGEMLSFNLTWDRKYVRPFPESTGRLACFFINGTGYVINQLDGQKPHVYAYDVDADTWTRKADFPGATNDRGIAFNVGESGYFGLGIDSNDAGVREIWKYDALGDEWALHSMYPGQGHQYVICYSLDGKAYLGWGYENRRVKGFSANEWIGCTDFWQFNP